MKFIKKVAALCFCAALALSVMAISASADTPVAHNFTVKLTPLGVKRTTYTTATDVSDVDGDGFNEYLQGVVGYKVELKADVTASETTTVNAIKLDLQYKTAEQNETLATFVPCPKNNSYNVTLTGDGVALTDGTTAFASATVDNLADVAWNGTTHCSITLDSDNDHSQNGFTISNTYTQIATLYFQLTGEQSQRNSIEITTFNVKEIAPSESKDATIVVGNKNGNETTGVLEQVEIDPEYTITVKNPAVNSSTNISDHTYTGNTEVAFYKYSILTGLMNTKTTASDVWGTLSPKAVVTPSLYYYDFVNYTVASTEGNSWSASSYTPAQLNHEDNTGTDNANQCLLTHNKTIKIGTLYGDVTLNAQYTPTVYTVTIKNPVPDSNGIIAFDNVSNNDYTADTVTYASAQTYYTAANTDEYQTFNYTIEGTTTGKSDATGAVTATIAKPTAHTAYEFTKYAILTETDTPVHNWGATAIAASALSSGTRNIGTGKYGNVTLEAKFVPIQYTVTYDLSASGTVTVNNNNYATDATTTFTYYINDTDDAGYAFVADPARPGYHFDNWSAAKTTNSAKDYSVSWPNEAFASNGLTVAGLYGDVTLTANWSITGEYVSKDYQYAFGTEKLVLFAVENLPEKAGAYTYDGNEMFKVAKKYEQAFGTKMVEEQEQLKVNGATYTIFAYIADNPLQSKIAYEVGNKTNEAIAYDGDMTGNSKFDAGDYGNVLSMLTNKSQYTNAQLTVKQRLNADMGVAPDSTDNTKQDWTKETGDLKFGSIDDVRWIMDKALDKDMTSKAVDISGPPPSQSGD